MGDIQTLRKPSNIPPVTLEELNDYSEGNKDRWVNSHKTGPSIQYARRFNDNNIYYLASNLVNYTGREEMIGYVKSGLVFLPFYKRIIKTGGPTGKWEDYTTNFDIGGQKKYLFVYDLGINEPAEREAGRSREDEERARRRAAEDDIRDSRRVQEEIERSLRLMEQMDTQREAEEKKREEKRLAAAARLREVERKGESEGEGEGIQLKTKNPETGKWEGGRRTRRRRSSRKLIRTRRHKSTHSRKLKQSRRRTRKLKKSRK
jgi:hypothetical protein